MSEELLKALIAEQRTTNDLLRAHLQQRGAVDEVYRPPRFASDEIKLALRLAENWVAEVKAAFSVGNIPSDVPGALILALANLPNTLSQPLPNRGAVGSEFYRR